MPSGIAPEGPSNEGSLNKSKVQACTTTLWYTNACSLREKWGELATRAQGSDIVAITETWMRPDYNIINFDAYSGYRQERVDGRQGGGVLLLVKACHSQWEAPLALATPNIQATACFVRLGRRPLCVLCVYRAPLATPAEDVDLMALLQELRKRAPRFVLVGDFNLPEIVWEDETAPTGSTGATLIDWLHNHAFAQHVTQATRFRAECRPSMLDLVITRYETDVESVTLDVPLGKSDHGVLLVTMTTRHIESGPSLVRNYGKINEDALRLAAEGITWVPEEAAPSIEERWGTIKAGIAQLTDQFAPLVPRRNRQRPPWWAPSISRSLVVRRRCWAAYKLHRTNDAWCSYKSARNRAQALQRTAKYQYECKLAKDVKQNPKRFYAYVQAKGTTREGVGTLEMSDGTRALNDEAKANTLLAFFKSVYRNSNVDVNALPTLECRAPVMIGELMVSEEEVLHELGSLNKHKAAGPDGIHPAIIQPLAAVLQIAVTQLFESSLRECVLPDDWLKATVVGIHKSGPKHKAANYRPVSLTAVLCKCLERILRKQICKHLVEHRLLSPTQHGFVEKRSCLTNLLSFLEEVTRRLDEGSIVQVCYLDFSKAFDSVSHCLLKYKLRSFGIVGRAMEWISQFLTNRTFNVKVGDYVSQAGRVTSGVPQGSVLGPILFLLFVNDLVQELENPCFMFADDVKLAGSDLKQDIEAVHRWSIRWDLPLNNDKCKILTNDPRVSEGTDLPVQIVTEVKDLGIIVTQDFKPSSQCREAATKARGVLFKVYTSLTCRNSEIFTPTYIAIVRPHLEYCVQAWAPYCQKDIDCLERVQRLATRMIAGQKHKSYEQRLRDLDLFSLQRRRTRGDLIETFKIVKGLSGLKVEDLFEFAPVRGTRGHSLKLQRHHSRLNVRAHFFANRVIPRWNDLPEDVVSCTNVIAFKHALDNCWSTVFPDLI